MADKSVRLEAMVLDFIDTFGADQQKTLRAAKLCKCDLATKIYMSSLSYKAMLVPIGKIARRR